jgi:hypothetical protein
MTANFVRTNDTLEYGGAGGTELAYTFVEQALGIAIDTEAPAAVDGVQLSDADGVAVGDDVTITSEATLATLALNFPEGSWFNLGPAPTFTCAGLDYGSLVLGYCGTQPTDWGIGTDDWLMCGYPSDGARGTVTKFAAIPDCGGAGETKIIDSGGNELADYTFAATDYTWILADPVAWTIPTDEDTLTAMAVLVPNDVFTFIDHTEAALDLSGSSGTDGNTIDLIFSGAFVTSGAGLVLGDYYTLTGAGGSYSGALTTGANCTIDKMIFKT